MAEDERIKTIQMPELMAGVDSEIEACILPEIEGGDGIYRPIIIADQNVEIELTVDDAIRLAVFLIDATDFLEGRKSGMM